MRVHVLVGVTTVGLLCAFAAAAVEPGEPRSEGTAVEGALTEPADPDDQADIRADDDPNDVGQEALEPAESAPPSDPSGPDDATGPD